MGPEADPWWTPTRETDEEIEARIAHFFSWLAHSPTRWRNVALVGHSSFMLHSRRVLGVPDHWPANCECVSMLVHAHGPAARP
mmetsp:Transcript_8210/g.26081  ORF Transcript_8210/g.26081 Transcript_8210/m.26081 type:complete len:83 (+) Transcript_8210:1-249(+)